jgi:hypothetical protein
MLVQVCTMATMSDCMIAVATFLTFLATLMVAICSYWMARAGRHQVRAAFLERRLNMWDAAQSLLRIVHQEGDFPFPSAPDVGMLPEERDAAWRKGMGAVSRLHELNQELLAAPYILPRKTLDCVRALKDDVIRLGSLFELASEQGLSADKRLRRLGDAHALLRNICGKEYSVKLEQAFSCLDLHKY